MQSLLRITLARLMYPDEDFAYMPPLFESAKWNESITITNCDERPEFSPSHMLLSLGSSQRDGAPSRLVAGGKSDREDRLLISAKHLTIIPVQVSFSSQRYSVRVVYRS